MDSLAALTTAGLAALLPALAPSTEDPDDAASATPVDDKLRLLALLNPVVKLLIDDIAVEVGSSAVRAVLLALLTEDLARTTGRAQIVAAGKVEETDAHTLCEEPLEELHELHGRLEDFVSGAIALPADERHRPGTKMLFRDATGILKDRLSLSFSQAKHRLVSRDLLLPHAGFNGATIAPRFELLGKVFTDGTADPLRVEGTARRLLTLQPGIDAQGNPEQTSARIEREVAESLVARNQSGTDQLLKHLSAQLDATALERSEAQMEDHFGMRFQSKTARGFIWEICTGVEGHELLTTLADQLANPHSAFGGGTASADNTVPSAAQDSGEQPALPGFSASSSSPDADTIPSWAIDPAIPLDQRPRAGFTDLGQPAATGTQGPGIQVPPGESLAEARERLKARNLLQAFFDTMRFAISRDRDAEPGLPARPNIEMIVTISWDSLVGKLNDPGITTHGHLVSAGYARRLACVSNVIPAVLGTESQPLDLGRTQRFFSRAQRRAMALRDRGCINPGCTMAAHRCEANHIEPWYRGGKTNLSNGALLCPICHASFHAGHFKIMVVNSIPYVLQSKALDPEQRLRRNWIFHPQSAPVQ
ncbi:HNH endonuclease [Paeniglutamicibacter sp.]|uniref:HNH endonuclease signature motif containing protein n=1 Tax=Paeniglutamicibacter sp. TaxID=1934391 RepID=UPI003989DF18